MVICKPKFYRLVCRLGLDCAICRPNLCRRSLRLCNFLFLTNVVVWYGIPEPIRPLTPAQWYEPWPWPLVRGRAPGPLSHGPRPRAAILDLRHVGPAILAQTPRGTIRALLGHLHPKQECDCLGIHVSAAQYSLREYRCQTSFRRWKPVPMPLLPLPTKHPLRHNGIGPAFPLIIRNNHDTPTDLTL